MFPILLTIFYRYQRCEFGDDMEANASDEEVGLAAFQKITRTFIFDGSPDEINLRWVRVSYCSNWSIRHRVASVWCVHESD